MTSSIFLFDFLVKPVELLIVKLVEEIKSKDKSKEEEKYSSLLNSLSNSLFMLSIIKKDEYCDILQLL